jgi:uncharacterized protein (TIGR02246 family)
MRVTTLCWILAGALLLAVACAQPAPEEEAAAPGPSDEELLQEMVTAWDAGLNGHDTDAILALYADDDATAMAPNQPALAGKEAIRGWLDTLFAQGTVQVANQAAEIQVSGDWAFSRGTYTLSVTPEEGEPAAEAGEWISISKRQADGSWKAVRNIWNTDSPPPGVDPPPGAAAAEAEEVPPPETPVCVDSLAAADQAFVDNVVAGDVAAVVALHTETARRVPPDLPAVVGRPALTGYVQTFVDLFEPRDLTVTQAGNQAAGDWGLTWGVYEFAYTLKEGGETFSGNGKYVTVDRLGDDGCWRYEWVLWNSDNPRPTP